MCRLQRLEFVVKTVAEAIHPNVLKVGLELMKLGIQGDLKPM